MKQALDFALKRDGIYNYGKYLGEFPDFLIDDVIENGAVYSHARQGLTYGYVQDPERLGLPNNYVTLNIPRTLKLQFVQIYSQNSFHR